VLGRAKRSIGFSWLFGCSSALAVPSLGWLRVLWESPAIRVRHRASLSPPAASAGTLPQKACSRLVGRCLTIRPSRHRFVASLKGLAVSRASLRQHPAAVRLNSGVSAHIMISATGTNPGPLLQQLFAGATVWGVRFGSLQLLFQPSSGSGELFISLSSAFQVFESMPAAFPESESEVPDLSEEAELLSLFALRGYKASQVEIVEPGGHLAVTFANGTVLYVNGNNAGPEPWHAGLNALDRAESAWVIAISGGKPIAYTPG
jgi:hypothetical protein